MLNFLYTRASFPLLLTFLPQVGFTLVGGGIRERNGEREERRKRKREGDGDRQRQREVCTRSVYIYIYYI